MRIVRIDYRYWRFAKLSYAFYIFIYINMLLYKIVSKDYFIIIIKYSEESKLGPVGSRIVMVSVFNQSCKISKYILLIESKFGIGS